MPDVYYTVDELATRWKLSVKTVRRLIWAEKLKAIKIGVAIRVPDTEVERYERSRPAA